MTRHVRLLLALLALPATQALAQAGPATPVPGVGQQVVMGLLFYNACATSYPDMATRYAKGYRAWRGRNSTMITTLENEPGVKGAIAEAVRQAKETATRDKDGAGAKTQCESFMATTFAEPGATAPPPAATPAPPQPAATPTPAQPAVVPPVVPSPPAPAKPAS
jgi:hypothetical protein